MIIVHHNKLHVFLAIPFCINKSLTILLLLTLNNDTIFWCVSDSTPFNIQYICSVVSSQNISQASSLHLDPFIGHTPNNTRGYP